MINLGWLRSFSVNYQYKILFKNQNLKFTRVPFGINVSVAVFVKTLNEALLTEILKFTTTYVDDLLIASKDFTTHCRHVEQLSCMEITLHYKFKIWIIKYFRPYYIRAGN